MILPTKFRVRWPFGSGGEGKINFQDGRHGDQCGFPIRTIVAIFYLQAAPIIPTKFRVN